MTSVMPDSRHWDAMVVVTDHDGIDYRAITEHADLIIDTRNVYGRAEREAAGKIFIA